jgi:hypothetical protein
MKPQKRPWDVPEREKGRHLSSAIPTGLNRTAVLFLISERREKGRFGYRKTL